MLTSSSSSLLMIVFYIWIISWKNEIELIEYSLAYVGKPPPKLLPLSTNWQFVISVISIFFFAIPSHNNFGYIKFSSLLPFIACASTISDWMEGYVIGIIVFCIAVLVQISCCVAAILAKRYRQNTVINSGKVFN